MRVSRWNKSRLTFPRASTDVLLSDRTGCIRPLEAGTWQAKPHPRAVLRSGTLKGLLRPRQGTLEKLSAVGMAMQILDTIPDGKVDEIGLKSVLKAIPMCQLLER